MKTISILGSTGSIGCNALDVIRLHPDKFDIFALSGHENVDLLFTQAVEFNPSYIVTKDEKSQVRLTKLLKEKKINIEVLFGPDGYRFIAGHEKVSIVLAAITGAAGLISTMEAAMKGKKILLANKESMVMAGEMINDLLAKHSCNLLPVDSEHSAIWQCLKGESKHQIKRIILTGSGGPFRTKPKDEFNQITKKQALQHPNWEMGNKITIDSATMMNKGLEVIETFWLFGVKSNQIDIVIHPESIIHSMVEFVMGL